MPTSFRDKAANRTNRYQRLIAAKQAEGDYRRALHEAQNWLLEELAKVRRRRPQDADGVDAAVTESLTKLAEAVPFFKPEQGGRPNVAS